MGQCPEAAHTAAPLVFIRRHTNVEREHGLLKEASHVV